MLDNLSTLAAQLQSEYSNSSRFIRFRSSPPSRTMSPPPSSSLCLPLLPLPLPHTTRAAAVEGEVGDARPQKQQGRHEIVVHKIVGHAHEGIEEKLERQRRRDAETRRQKHGDERKEGGDRCEIEKQRREGSRGTVRCRKEAVR